MMRRPVKVARARPAARLELNLDRNEVCVLSRLLMETLREVQERTLTSPMDNLAAGVCLVAGLSIVMSHVNRVELGGLLDAVCDKLREEAVAMALDPKLAAGLQNARRRLTKRAS